MMTLRPVELEDAHRAAERLKSILVRTPLVRLNVEDAPAEIYLKMENLQPIGSFKVRPAGNAILSLPPAQRGEGVYTASSGNMAQGVAFAARTLGIPATVFLPQNAASNKVEALKRLGARIRFLPDDEWWPVLDNHGHPDEKGVFVHPVANQDVLAGDSTVALEIVEDLPDVDTVLVPFGGGGLTAGIASVLRSLKPNVRVLGAESDHCTPLSASLEAGRPLKLPIEKSFVSGIGIGRVLDEMWPLVRELVQGAVIASAREIADAVSLLAERHRIVVEGAGAAPVASALAGRAGKGKVVCVLSGGNLDTKYLIDILEGRIPEPRTG
jgi:threonine dehydratase